MAEDFEGKYRIAKDMIIELIDKVRRLEMQIEADQAMALSRIEKELDCRDFADCFDCPGNLSDELCGKAQKTTA
jgi:hypothetical protein